MLPTVFVSYRGFAVEASGQTCEWEGVCMHVVGEATLQMDRPTEFLLLPDVPLESRVVRPPVREVSGVNPTSSAAAMSSRASSILLRQDGAASPVLRPRKCLKLRACWRRTSPRHGVSNPSTRKGIPDNVVCLNPSHTDANMIVTQ